MLQIRICDRIVRKEGCDRAHGMKGGESSRYDAHLLRSEGIQNCREADQEDRVKRKELFEWRGVKVQKPSNTTFPLGSAPQRSTPRYRDLCPKAVWFF